jgi:hypothetical protein
MTHRTFVSHWQVVVLFLCFVVTTFLCSCTPTMVVTPQIMENNMKSDFHVRGMLEYDGNRDYLPRTIKDDSGQTVISFIYQYQITYGRDKIPQALPLFNPLTIVGFPIGENTIAVTGNLKVLKGKEVIKSYTATCGLEKVRSIFSEGDTFSELRKIGLLTVRDNIELQMYQDRDFLAVHTTNE